MRRAATVFLVAAGLTDLGTGLLLLALPAFVVGVLDPGVPTPAEPVFVRWLGVFVASVGSAYLYPWIGGARRRHERLATVIEVTALQRSAVALFVGGAVATGALGLGWLAVALFDGGVAAAQLAILRREVGDAR